MRALGVTPMTMHHARVRLTYIYLPDSGPASLFLGLRSATANSMCIAALREPASHSGASSLPRHCEKNTAELPQPFVISLHKISVATMMQLKVLAARHSLLSATRFHGD